MERGMYEEYQTRILSPKQHDNRFSKQFQNIIESVYKIDPNQNNYI